MDQIEFADGFDRPDSLAFGLGAGQLAVVMVGALAAYSLVRSPLPPWIADPLAVVIAAAAAGIGWVRVSGRPALDWAIFAGLYWMRPRRGVTQWVLATATPSDGASAGQTRPAPVIRLFGRRSDQRTSSSNPPGDPPSGDRSPTPASAPTDPAGVAPTTDPAPAQTARSPLGPNILPTLRPPTRAGGARRVTFFSLRGGTGRSTLATELACLIASSESADHPAPLVALVDLDLRSPSVAIRLGTPERTVLDYALAPPEDRAVIDFMVRHASGARVLLGPQSAVNPEWPVTPALLREVLRELDMEGFDLVVLDVSPGADRLEHDGALRVR